MPCASRAAHLPLNPVVTRLNHIAGSASGNSICAAAKNVVRPSPGLAGRRVPDHDDLRPNAGEDALAAAFRNHYRQIFRYFARRVGSDAASDLTAEVFRRAVERWDRYSADRPLRPWLFGIAANVRREHARGLARLKRALSRLRFVPGPDPLSDVLHRLQAKALGPALTRALGRLRDVDREVLLLYAWEDLTYEEIAEALGMPVGTVRSGLHRARRRLRELLSDSGQERDEGNWRASPLTTVEEPTDG